MSSENGLVLRAEKVTKRFGGLVAVNSVDFTIPARSIVSLIGPNGAGKTTFFNIIAGIYDPTGGVIEFRGRPMIARSRRTALEPILWVVPALLVGVVVDLVAASVFGPDAGELEGALGFLVGGGILVGLMLAYVGMLGLGQTVGVSGGGIGRALSGLLGGLITWSWAGALTAFFWAGLVRIALIHHVTWSINSVCHVWGKQPFRSRDESRNNRLVALLVFGEGWHNNHHAFPVSARHGLDRGQIDVSWWVIRGLERLGLVWDVKTPDRAQLDRRRVQSAAS